MRLALLIYGSLETLSGGYLYDQMLVKALERRGDVVTVLSLPWRDYPNHLMDNFSPALYRQLAGLQVDILLQDELNHPSLFWLNQRLSRNAVKVRQTSPLIKPVISIVHHLRCSEARPVWQNSLYRWVERRYLESVNGFIFNSRTTQKVVEGLIGSGKPSLVAFPGGDRLQPGLTEEEITIRAHQSGPLRILFLGSVIPRKGLHILLASLALIPKELWRLTIAGRLDVDRAYVEQIRRILANSCLRDCVEITGSIGDMELKHLLLSSQILAVPSSYEGFGIVFLEGMGFGLPVIATKAGAAPEMITHEQDGFLVEPGDVQALANHLQTVALDRNRLLALSLAAQKRYQDYPTWEQMMDRVRQYLAAMAG